MTRTLVSLTLASFLPCLVSCNVDDPGDPSLDEPVATAEEPIVGGSFPPSWVVQRAVYLGNCTGTLIAPRWVLTAAHCKPKVGNKVYGYVTYFGADFTRPASIRLVHMRPGVVPGPGPIPDYNDYFDNDGDFADVALLALGSDLPSSTSALMQWTFPDTLVNGTQVGAGLHEDGDNDGGLLLSRNSVTSDDNDDFGNFRLALDTTDDGDSGGPFYDQNRHILGDLWGTKSGLNLYTSVPFHLEWILTTIGWSWPHGGISTTLVRRGAGTSFDTPSSKVCQYACSNTTSCVAFTHSSSSDTCRLVESELGPLVVDSSQGYTSGQK